MIVYKIKYTILAVKNEIYIIYKFIGIKSYYLKNDICFLPKILAINPMKPYYFMISLLLFTYSTKCLTLGLLRPLTPFYYSSAENRGFQPTFTYW